MARDRSERGSNIPSAAGGLARLVVAHADGARFDIDPVLKKAALTRQQLENRSWISARSQMKFVNLAADALGDECLGFHLGESFDLREANLLYYVLASSDRLVEALQRSARYTAIVNEGIAQTCKESGGDTRVIFRYVGVSRHLDRHEIEFWMTGLMRFCRHLTGLRLQAKAARFTHRREHCPRELTAFFGGDVEFGASHDELVFDKRVGELPVVSADPYLSKLLLKYAEEALGHRGKRSSFRASVENAVVPLLPHGKARADHIARELGVSPRTLARRLAEEGLTFSALVQSLRTELSRRYLAEESLSISQIAWLLGYREVGAFSHAFKRQTGSTPREARGRL